MEFCTSSLHCFKDLVKAYIPVPQGVLSGVLQEYGFQGHLLQVSATCFQLVLASGFCQSCPLSPNLHVTFMDRISMHSQQEVCVQFSDLRFTSLLFVDDVLLLPSSDSYLHWSRHWSGLQPSVKQYDESQPLRGRGHDSLPDNSGLPPLGLE